MLFFRRLLAQFKAWQADRRASRTVKPPIFNFSVHMASIHRDVTPNGVRVVWLLAFLCAGVGLLAYIVLWIVLPAGPTGTVTTSVPSAPVTS